MSDLKEKMNSRIPIQLFYYTEPFSVPHSRIQYIISHLEIWFQTLTLRLIHTLHVTHTLSHTHILVCVCLNLVLSV
jgi:hypothetical protein